MTSGTPKTIDSTEDIIDVRDIIARIEHLEQLEQLGAVDLGEDNDTAQDDLFSELASLRELMSDLRRNGGDEQWRGDWYPITLIRETYFVEYAQELAEDIGAVKSDLGWPYACIDWERAADELKIDYTSAEFDDATYWYR